MSNWEKVSLAAVLILLVIAGFATRVKRTGYQRYGNINFALVHPELLKGDEFSESFLHGFAVALDQDSTNPYAKELPSLTLQISKSESKGKPAHLLVELFEDNDRNPAVTRDLDELRTTLADYNKLHSKDRRFKPMGPMQAGSIAGTMFYQAYVAKFLSRQPIVNM